MKSQGMLIPMRLKTKEEFQGFFERICRTAQFVFEKDGYHCHMLALVTPKGVVQFVVDSLSEEVDSEMTRRNGKPDPQWVKDQTMRIVSHLAEQSKAYGYLSVGEVWTVKTEGVHDANAMLQKYGAVQNVPTRKEQLMVFGRFGKEGFARCWDIVRAGEEVILRDAPKDPGMVGSEGGRFSVLDEIVARNLSGSKQA